jgi:hypothetical protein
LQNNAFSSFVIHQKQMNDPIALYNLYCLNIRCEASIYHNNTEIQVVFDAENLSANHICTCCRYSLFSAMDFEIEQVTAELGVITMNKPYYNSNQ